MTHDANVIVLGDNGVCPEGVFARDQIYIENYDETQKMKSDSFCQVILCQCGPISVDNDQSA